MIALLLAAALPTFHTGGDPTTATKLPAPGVRLRMNQASATRAPWVDSNGARYLRGLKSAALVAAGENRADLAAFEAYVFNAEAAIAGSPKDKLAFDSAIAFLQTLPKERQPNLADITFFDDGSVEALENMNLLLRRNLQFRVVTKDERGAVKPKSGNPSEFAYEVRKKVGDEKRLLRVYGSEVVIARLEGDARRRTVHLLNYANRAVDGVRVRVAGTWKSVRVYASDGALEASDIVHEAGVTEFSLARIAKYVVVVMTP